MPSLHLDRDVAIRFALLCLSGCFPVQSVR
jgi:hypothetical protein